jgi:zinc-binding alcohol dehydrogenase/oxidoreductase
MKALVLAGKDLPLMFEEVETPVAGDGFTIVKLKAAALNHRDVWIHKGMYGGIKYPTILGSDGAGTLADGTEVIINAAQYWGDSPSAQGKNFKILGLPDDGTFAEFVKVPTEAIYPKPKHLTFQQAAAVPLVGVTAWRALMSKCQAKTGEKVLISGIGGGVALFAMQFAVALGCEVWVTSSSEDKIAHAKKLGAKGGINYRTEGWAKSLLEQTEGFDVIIDSAAGDGFTEFIGLCRMGGRIAFYGATTLGKITNLDPRRIFWNQLSIHGSTMGSPEDFNAMLEFINKHEIIPIVDSVFELRDGNAALKKMDEGKQFGKIVLSI